ncbi:hypothetical protein EJB05_15776, partial [Eragrostis curvula]
MRKKKVATRQDVREKKRRRRRHKRKSSAGPLVSGGLAVGGGGRPGILTSALFSHRFRWVGLPAAVAVFVRFVGMEHWRRMCLDGGGESNAPSSMKNKVLRPLLCLVMVFLDHNCRLVRVWFPVTFIWMLLGFVFSHCEYGEGGDDKLGYGLDGGEFFILACGISVYPSFAKGLGFSFPPSEMRMTVMDGEMAVFFQIGVFVRGISVWDGDLRWWNLWLFQGFLSLINGVGVDWDVTVTRGCNMLQY